MMNYLWFLLLSAFWGASFVAIKFAINDFPPFFSAFLRVALSLIILRIIFIVFPKNLTVPFAVRKKMWLVGLFAQGIPFSFLFWGERFISPGLAGILNGTVPIWAFILSIIFIRGNEFSGSKIIGLLLGIVGVIVIFSPMLKFTGQSGELIGSLALLGMALSYAIGGLLNQQLFAHQKQYLHANIYHQHCSSVTFLLLISLLFEKWPHWQVVISSPTLWISVGYLAVFSTALAWLIYYWLIQEWGAVRASTATYVAPIMAIFWDFVFFHNTPNTTEVLGIITILLGVIFIQVPRKFLLKVFGIK